jgi:putative hydrolase of the HAD superfamily
MQVSTIVFDFGNVIAHFDYKIAAGRIGQPLGLSGAELMARAMELGFHPLLMDLESGRIDENSFFTELKKRLLLPQNVQQIAEDWADIFTANEPVHDLAHKLADNGYRLVLGSNTNAVHARQFRRQFAALLDRFDALVMSHEVGAMKPARLFYERCHTVAGSRPDECVFIDDMAENIEGARAAGLHAVHYTGTENLVEKLRELFIRI